MLKLNIKKLSICYDFSFLHLKQAFKACVTMNETKTGFHFASH